MNPVKIFLLIGVSVVYLTSCMSRDVGYENVSGQDELALPPPVGSIGPARLTEAELGQISNGSSRELAKNYAAAVEAFRSVYGLNSDPYMIPLLRAGRFIAYKAWNKNKEASNFNPITMTDKYNFDVDTKNRICRKPDFSGRPSNVWMVFERASRYVQNAVIEPVRSGKPVFLSATYRSLPYVQKAAGQIPATTSEFGLDFFLSLNVENGEGAVTKIDGCSKLGQFRACDGIGQSPFFDPFEALRVCRSNDAASPVFARWRPSAGEWAVILSPELRNIGQLAAPMPSPESLGGVVPAEVQKQFAGGTCATPAVANHLKQAYQSGDAISKDWPGLKKTYPQFTRDAMKKGAAFLGEQSGQGQIEAFNLHASVRQVYKDVANYDLKSGVLDEQNSCAPCALQRSGRGIVWDVEFAQGAAAPCPKVCLKKSLAAPGSAAFRESDTARPLFEPSRNDQNYRSISSELNRYFGSMKSGGSLAADPVDLGAELQRWFVAMHPFSDGNGRTSRFIKEIVLHSAGLPMPIVTDFWSDTGSSLADYQRIVRAGIGRHIEILKACTRFQKCAQNGDANSCAGELSFVDPNGQKDTNLKPLDCSIAWERDPEKAKFAQCK